LGAAAKGLTGVGTEFTNSGMQSRLTPTAITALPASPGTSTNGERLAIGFYNHTAAGTVSVAGTAPLSLAAITELTSSIPTMELPGEVAWYATTNIFGAVNASGVTIGSGLTGGTVVIYGIQAANRLVVGEWKLADKVKEHSPTEQRGVYDADFHLLALAQDPEWELTQDFYADDGLWLFQGAYASAATSATIPAAPPTILTAATSVTTAGNASATAQPTAPGMIIGITLTGSPTTAQTVSVTGVNLFGETVIEVVVPSTKTAGTWYSSNVFTSIAANGIVWGAFGAGTIGALGYFGWKLSGNPSDILSSFALEQYDSTASYIAPFALVDEWSMEGGSEKEWKVQAKGPCQQVIPVGNPATTTNQITQFGQIIDKPYTGWRAFVTIDALSGTIGTTQNLDAMDWKLVTKINWKSKHTSWGNPPTRTWNRAYRQRRKIEVEFTLDMTQATFQAEYDAWKKRRKRLVQLTLRGVQLGIDGGTTYYHGGVFNLPVRWVEVAERDFQSGKDSVEVKLKGICEFENSLGYSHNYTWFSRLPVW